MREDERRRISNPFELTKASEYTDEQIYSLWVDLPEGSGLVGLLRPTSTMSMIVRGSKGSGKTHLMRFCSLPLQQRRYPDNLLEGVGRDGYVGIYMRGDGLHAGRFKDKGKPEEFWLTVFEYYFDLWLAELCIDAAIRLLGARGVAADVDQHAICKEISECFTTQPEGGFNSLSETKEIIRDLRAEIDDEVNNLPFTGAWTCRVRATRGKLVFGVPKALRRHIPELRKVIFLYLIDEVENFNEQQQKYLQTLIRFKDGPCSFRLGARLYGVKTYKTDSDDEPNKPGSEFDFLELDRVLRDNQKYGAFSRALCAKRLIKAGLIGSEHTSENEVAKGLDGYFVVDPSEDYASAVFQEMVSKYPPLERPYFLRLRKQLAKIVGAKSSLGVSKSSKIDELIKNLSFDKYPLLEKVNILLFYQAWYEKRNLIKASKEISALCEKFIRSDSGAEKFSDKLSHFKSDLVAQLYRECKAERPTYASFETFVRMSQGIPRNLLVIVKNVFQWSSFNNERPFDGGLVSLESQRKGIAASSEWFWDDAQPGDRGSEVKNSVTKIAEFFKEVRFSDKPSECALVTFSTNLSEISENSRKTILGALNWSYLIEISAGALDKNSKRVDGKFQLNPMLAPRWSLSTSRRGTIGLSSAFVNSIFDDEYELEFNGLMRQRLVEMRAPTFSSQDGQQNLTLPLDSNV
ncbi:MAG: hypothetical protein KF771_05750 [Burkholderiales bacterium]|nr:hypothetical protein [Burkholderiales bacterium]